jgi:hypothetical protein
MPGITTPPPAARDPDGPAGPRPRRELAAQHAVMSPLIRWSVRVYWPGGMARGQRRSLFHFVSREPLQRRRHILDGWVLVFVGHGLRRVSADFDTYPLLDAHTGRKC